MPAFTYRARDEKGKLVTGTTEAETKGSAYTQLDSMGLLPISVVEVTEPFSAKALLTTIQRVKPDDLIFFTRQLHTVVRSGVPLIAGLRALKVQTNNRTLRQAAKEISRDIEAGQSFSDALSRHRKIFSEVYVSMVRAGETGGTLEEVLLRLAEVLEFQMKTKEAMKSAMRYPVFVLVTLVVAFTVLMRFVVPRFVSLFQGAKIELPWPTKILLAMSHISQAYGAYIVVLIIGSVVLFVMYKRTENGAMQLDMLKLKVPIIGPLILQICMSRFANMFENLMRAGVPITRTLEIVSKTVGNRYLAEKILTMGAKIEKGKGIAKPIREAEIFPPLVVHLITTGEDTGSLEYMLKEISNHYDREVNYSVSRLSAWIEPILTVCLSGMVLFVALAIFLPWWNLMETMRAGQ